MRILSRGILALALAFAGGSLQSQTTVVDDAFADGNRTSQTPSLGSPPYSSIPWWATASVSTSALGLQQTLSSSGRLVWGYFTAQGSPITLAVGESITLRFDYTYSSDFTGGADMLRIGLFNAGADTRQTADGGFLNSHSLKGYYVTGNSQTASGTGAAIRWEDNTLTAGTNNATTTSSSVSGALGSTFSSLDATNALRTAELVITRTDATTMTISIDFDTNTAGGVTTRTDTSLYQFSFDAVAILNSSSTGATVTMDNFRVIYTPNSFVTLDDQFADGNRSSQTPSLGSPPYSSIPWWVTSNVSTSTSGMEQGLTSSGRLVWGYFAPQGSPVSLAVGQSIALRFDYTYSSNFSGTSEMLRFGLFHGGADARQTADGGFLNAHTLKGYVALTNAQTASGSGSTMRWQDNTLIAGTNNATTTSSSVSGVLGSSFASIDAGAAVKTAEMIVTRTDASTMTISVDLDTSTTGDAVSRTDTAVNQFSFDSVAILAVGSGNLTYDNVEVAVESDGGGGGGGYAYGLDVVPPWAPALYNQATDIPADAVDYATGNGGSSFASLAAACNYCVTNNKPLKINVNINVTSTSDLGIKCPKGIYGYGATKPKISYTGTGVIGNETKALLYVWKNSPVLRWLQFEDFGDVLDVACGSLDRDGDGIYWEQFGDTSSAAFRRAVPPGYPVGAAGGVGVQIDTSVWPITTLNNNGPAFDVQECDFIDCQHAVYYLSDSLKHGPSKFGRNKLIGTYGGVAIHNTILGDFDAWMNEWTGLNATDPRGAIPIYLPGTTTSTKANRFHTMFAIGAEYYGDMHLNKQTIRIWSNYVHGVEDDYMQDTVNAATFVDMRGNNPATITNGGNPDTYDCSVSIKYNRIQHLYGLRGQEDCNAIYTKSLGHTIEYNWFEDCGSDFVSTGTLGGLPQDGTECSAVLCKEPANFDLAQVGAAWAHRHNVYVDMPPVDGVDTASSQRLVAKVAEPQVDWFSINETFVNCVYNSTGASFGSILYRTDDGTSAGIKFNGYINGTTLTVTSMVAGSPPIRKGIRFNGGSANPITGITANTSGIGGTGNYTVDVSQTVGSAGSPVAFKQTCRSVVKGTWFFNCPATAGHQIYFHSPQAPFGAATTIQDTYLYNGPNVNYATAAMIVGTDASGLTGVVHSNNFLVGTGNTYLGKVLSGDTGGPYGAMSVPAEPTLSGPYR